MDVTRRGALTVLAVGSAALLAGPSARADDKPPAPTAPGKHEVVALPFDPTKLRGLSERLLVSHHDNNYAGAVKNLNKVEEQLATRQRRTRRGSWSPASRSASSPSRNSVILHEHYFGEPRRRRQARRRHREARSRTPSARSRAGRSSSAPSA